MTNLDTQDFIKRQLSAGATVIKADADMIITRNGEIFSYQSKYDAKPVEMSMTSVFDSAAWALKSIDRAAASIRFISDAFEAFSKTGTALDEYQLQGASDLCMAVHAALDDQMIYPAHQIIEAMKDVRPVNAEQG